MTTSEREEKITGYQGVKNKKGEIKNPGSTTGPKGGPGLGDDGPEGDSH